MDRVRFGRALGFGARQAAKTLVTAVDAVTAENPAAKATSAVGRSGQAAGGAQGAAHAHAESPVMRSTRDTLTRTAARSAARTVTQARDVKKGLRHGSKRFGEAVWGPFVRLSGVLWLEVSGVFFGIFALLALGYVWKLRGAWHSGAGSAANHRSLMGAVLMLTLFGYFCVSSFVRARRRERRR